MPGAASRPRATTWAGIVLCCLLLTAAMPGGFLGGPGFMAIFMAVLGGFIGYLVLLSTSVAMAFSTSPRRRLWRWLAVILLLVGATCVWFFSHRP